jgi:hypothetical protein
MTDSGKSEQWIGAYTRLRERSPIDLDARAWFLDYAFRAKPNPQPLRREFGPIWQYWHSGRAELPEICRLCFDSVSRAVAPRNVVILDDTSLCRYIRLPPHLLSRREQMSTAHFSDVVRTYLLATHGGTWIDASVLLTGPIDHITSDLPFFAFTRPNDPLMLSNWFLHAAAGHPLICAMRDLLTEYWRENESVRHYHVFHLLFECAITVHAELRRAWQAVPVLLTGRQGAPRALQDALTLGSLSPGAFQDICRRTPVHKLSWKLPEAALAEALKLRQFMNERA